MIYLLPMALFVWLLGFAKEQTGLKQNNYKLYLIIAGTVIALVMGLRTNYTGSTDTIVYIWRFEDICAFDNFFDYYRLNLQEEKFLFAESGYYLFTWLLSRVTQEGQMLVLITSCFITFGTCRFIYKNTQDPPLALLIYVCLGLFTFNMNGLRQAMAMSICMMGYELVKKRKLLWFLVVVFIAMQFHKTAFCFIIVYLFPLFKEGKANVFWYLVGIVIFLFSVDQFIELANVFTGEEYLTDYSAEGGGVVVVMIYIGTIALSLIMIDSMRERQKRTQFLCVVLGFAMYISRYFSNQILERLSYYFFYFTLPLIPNLIGDLEEREQRIVKIMFCLFALFLFAYRLDKGLFNNFRFYFQMG